MEEKERLTRERVRQLCELAYWEKWLELTGHKVGDEVKCAFRHDMGDMLHSYTTVTIGKGVIVRRDEGLFVESVQKYRKSHEVRVNPKSKVDYSVQWKYRYEHILARIDEIEDEYAEERDGRIEEK